MLLDSWKVDIQSVVLGVETKEEQPICSYQTVKSSALLPKDIWKGEYVISNVFCLVDGNQKSNSQAVDTKC